MIDRISHETDVAILSLLAQRGVGKTICPSEAARVVAGEDGDWRAQMENVHLRVDALVEAGTIALFWKGKKLGQRRGAYRIARRWPAE